MMSFKKRLFCSLCSFSVATTTLPYQFTLEYCYVIGYVHYANVTLYVTINKKSGGNVKGLSSPGEFVIDALLLFFTIKRGRIKIFYFAIIR